MFRLNDGRPSDVHAHVHCLRSEQCACAYDLSNKSLLDGSACLIMSWTRQKLLVKSLRTR